MSLFKDIFSLFAKFGDSKYFLNYLMGFAILLIANLFSNIYFFWLGVVICFVSYILIANEVMGGSK